MTRKLSPSLDLSFVFTLALFTVLTGPSPAEAQAGKRESFLDRIVRIEPEFHAEVPAVPRHCDELDLKKRRVDIGDCELYVEEEGDGVPLVLINGGPGGTHHCFHPWFGRAAGPARVIYYDQRGTGLSDYEPGPNGYSVAQAVADLEALRKALAIDKWVVLGYSYGGFLAQYYTTKYPESLAGLVLLGASPGMWAQLEPTRQYDYVSKEERQRIREVYAQAQKLAGEQGWAQAKTMAVQVYNAHLNGDWKRQHFYRPSPEKFARGALYEWNFDIVNNFRGGIGGSMGKVDLTGAFETCPIPTLIMEGKWDLTWNTDKPGLIAGNHPGARLAVFENAAHGIYDEETDRFFTVLREFLTGLPEVEAVSIAAYKRDVDEWDRRRRSSPLFIVRTNGNGTASLTKIAQAYTKSWCEALRDQPLELHKVGQALYEVKEYAEGLHVFEQMAGFAAADHSPEYRALALIWQGHMLDLLGRRDRAVQAYREAAALDVHETWTHDQYDMKYELSAYARERLATPFVRIENKRKD